jgi:hypothetical protein
MAYGNNVFTVTSMTLKQSERRQRKRRPSNEELARRLNELERTCEAQFEFVIEAIQRLMRQPVRKRKPIGFRPATSRKRSKL